MFLSSFEKLRRTMLRKQWIVSMLHLGTRAFDSIGGEVVSSTAFVIENVPPSRRANASARRGSFVRIVDGKSEAEKITMLDRARHTREAEDGFHGASPEDFAVIPGSPIVYWLSEKIRASFWNFPPLDTRSRSAKGLVTADNESFVRLWWEIELRDFGLGYADRESAKRSKRRWFPYAKGGEFRRWAGNMESVVDWEDDGRRIQTTLTSDGSRVRATNLNLDRIFKEGIAWTVVTSGQQAFRLVRAGALFDAAAGICQSTTNEDHLALLNSNVANILLSAINPTLNLHPGYLGAIPIPNDITMYTIGDVRALINNSQDDWDGFETSWQFASSPLVAISQELHSLQRWLSDSK